MRSKGVHSDHNIVPAHCNLLLDWPTIIKHMLMVLAPFTSDFWKSTFAKVALPLHLKRIPLGGGPLRKRSSRDNSQESVAKRRSVINRAQVRNNSGSRRPVSPPASHSPAMLGSPIMIDSANAMSPTIPSVKRSQTMPTFATYHHDQDEEELEGDNDDLKSESSFQINNLQNNSKGLPLRNQKRPSPDNTKPVSLGNHFLSPDITVDLNLKLQRTNTSGVSGVSVYSYSFDHLSI